jgi:GT2 family glycosyltransferase
MDVTVVIITYNTLSLTRECIASVYEKTGKNHFEMIVVDNASTDGSRQVLPHLGYDRYRYVFNSVNKGFSRANNQAARMARGKYLFFMNSDMVFVNDVVGELTAHMQTHAGTGIAGPMFLNPDGSLQVSCRNFPGIWFGILKFFPFLKGLAPGHVLDYYQKDREYTRVQSVDTVSAGAMLISRTLFDAMGGFDEFSFMYAEDADICRQVRDRGKKVMFIPGARLIHYGGQSSRLNSHRAVWSYYLAFYHLYKKYYFKKAGWVLKPLFMARACTALLANLFKKDKRVTWNDK